MLLKLFLYQLLCIQLYLVRAFEPDDVRTVSELISTKGYAVEEHDVHTDDGYILRMQRIPCGLDKCRNDKAQRPPVILQHGIIDTAADWVLNGANQSLGFILADAGFDVWLGNTRGNKYSNRHVKYSIKEEAFWNFSFSDMAKYDVPAMVDHVLASVNASNLVYVGHSQGTMIMFAGLSMNETLQSKVKLFIALSPVATIGHLENNSLLKVLAKLAVGPSQPLVLDIVGRKSIFYDNSFPHGLINDTCHIPDAGTLLCSTIAFQICGPSKHLNYTRLPVYLLHTPAGTSVKNILHFGQLTQSDKFRMFDYGAIENMKKYHQATPPDFDLGKIRVPTALYAGSADWLADLEDIKFIRASMARKSIVQDVVVKDYDHLDFVWGLGATKDVYDPVVRLIKGLED